MSRDEREENVGQISVRSEESFWILPTRYVLKKKHDIYSPWFSYFGEKWQFVMSPKYYDSDKAGFYLWRKFCRDLPGRKYTLQLKLKTLDGEQIAFSEKDSNCAYGLAFDFVDRNDLLNPKITDCERVKIFFVIKEKFQYEDDLSLGTSEGENNQNGESREDELTSEDEMSSDEEDSENKRVIAVDKGIKTLLENFKQLFIGGKMTDVVLKVDNREFKVHKVILVARSPVFASMFQHDLAEKKNNEVDIPDCTAESFDVFLDYIYCVSTDAMSTSNVYNVYYAADKYQVDGLKKKCLKFMKKNLSVKTFCDVIALSLRHGESLLQETAVDFFCRNFREIIITSEWQKYLTENPIQGNELFIKASGTGNH